MPIGTYKPLATVTLGSSSQTVTFNSIPATYRDLIVIARAKLTSSAGTVWFRLNGDTGSNYNDVVMYGNGSAAVSNARTNQTVAFAGAIGTGDSGVIAQIMEYSAADKHKSFLIRENLPGSWVALRAARWASSLVVNSLTVGNDSGQSFAAGSVFSLYGIAG